MLDSEPIISSEKVNKLPQHIYISSSSHRDRIEWALTGEKQRTTCKFLLDLEMKYSYRLSKVGGWRGSSFFITPIRAWVISSISSRANRLEIFEEWTDSVLYFQGFPWPVHCQSLVLFPSPHPLHVIFFSCFLSASPQLNCWLARDYQDHSSY